MDLRELPLEGAVHVRAGTIFTYNKIIPLKHFRNGD